MSATRLARDESEVINNKISNSSKLLLHRRVSLLHLIRHSRLSHLSRSSLDLCFLLNLLSSLDERRNLVRFERHRVDRFDSELEPVSPASATRLDWRTND